MCFVPCHLRKCNKWPSQKIDCDCKFTYIWKTNEWIFHWVYETQKQVCETQVEVHVVSIDPGVCTPFMWYSSTKGAGKIGRWYRTYLLHMDGLISKRQTGIFNLKMKEKECITCWQSYFSYAKKDQTIAEWNSPKNNQVLNWWIWCSYYSSLWGFKYGEQKNTKDNKKTS